MAPLVLAFRRLRARRWRALAGAFAVAGAVGLLLAVSVLGALAREESARGRVADLAPRERLVRVVRPVDAAPAIRDGERALAGLGLDRPATVRVGGPVSPGDERGRILARAGLALLGLVVVSAGAGYALAGRALRPVREITATAQEISAGRLDRRIGATGAHDELRELADTFDAMLERLDRAFAEQRRFAAAASHELRTPLAVMRTAIDVALEDPQAQPSPRIERMIATLRETLARSERLVERLLVLARGDRGAGEAVRLDELVARHAEQARAGGARVDTRLRPTTSTAIRCCSSSSSATSSTTACATAPGHSRSPPASRRCAWPPTARRSTPRASAPAAGSASRSCAPSPPPTAATSFSARGPRAAWRSTSRYRPVDRSAASECHLFAGTSGGGVHRVELRGR